MSMIFQISPIKLAIVISIITMPIFFCGINRHGPSCKNLAMPHELAKIERKSFKKKIDMNPVPLTWSSLMVVESTRWYNTNVWGKVSRIVSEKKNLKELWPNVSTTPLWQWGFRQSLPFSWTTLRSKHCQHAGASTPSPCWEL